SFLTNNGLQCTAYRAKYSTDFRPIYGLFLSNLLVQATSIPVILQYFWQNCISSCKILTSYIPKRSYKVNNY
ncbi:unnamed protein product, partial [Urochloa humidicola]